MSLPISLKNYCLQYIENVFYIISNGMKTNFDGKNLNVWVVNKEENFIFLSRQPHNVRWLKIHFHQLPLIRTQTLVSNRNL